jgi:hypothetical protein
MAGVGNGRYLGMFGVYLGMKNVRNGLKSESILVLEKWSLKNKGV